MNSILNFKTHILSQDAEWLVFIHGAGGSISTWKRQELYFSRYFNILMIDLRDHGNSKNIYPEHESYKFEIISSDLKKVIDHHQIQSAHFVTLSFGSVLMQDFASRYPGYIEKLVFIGAVFNGDLALKVFVRLAKFLNLFLSYPTMYRLFSFILMPRRENQFARRLYRSQAKKIAQDEYMKWLGLYREFFKLLKQFSGQVLDVPSLIMMGENDYLFLQSAREFNKSHKTTELVEVAGAGHIVNIEKPDAFNRITLDFLRSHTD